MTARYRAEQDPRDAEGDPLELQLSAQEDTRGNRDSKHENRMCDTRAKK